MYRFFLKRLFDFILAMIVVLITMPIWTFVTVLLLFANQGKVFFTQKRIGKNNHPFYVVKFKSMNDKKDKEGNLLKDVERLTIVGKILRKTSLDELPQLINVLKGDMSLIGPRPLLPEYLPYYNEYHIRRHEVRPGITGLAQTEGRNTLTFSQRFNFDVQYVDNLSLILDIKIFFKTIMKVIYPRKDIQLGVRPMSEIDDIGITKALSKHYFNLDEHEK